jgi:hypothetical protein
MLDQLLGIDRRAQVTECSYQLIQIFWISRIGHVHVKGGVGRSMDEPGDAPYKDEVNLMIIQRTQDRAQVQRMAMALGTASSIPPNKIGKGQTPENALLGRQRKIALVERQVDTSAAVSTDKDEFLSQQLQKFAERLNAGRNTTILDGGDCRSFNSRPNCQSLLG